MKQAGFPVNLHDRGRSWGAAGGTSAARRRARALLPRGLGRAKPSRLAGFALVGCNVPLSPPLLTLPRRLCRGPRPRSRHRAPVASRVAGMLPPAPRAPVISYGPSRVPGFKVVGRRTSLTVIGRRGGSVVILRSTWGRRHYEREPRTDTLQEPAVKLCLHPSADAPRRGSLKTSSEPPRAPRSSRSSREGIRAHRRPS